MRNKVLWLLALCAVVINMAACGGKQTGNENVAQSISQNDSLSASQNNSPDGSQSISQNAGEQQETSELLESAEESTEENTESEEAKSEEAENIQEEQPEDTEKAASQKQISAGNSDDTDIDNTEDTDETDDTPSAAFSVPEDLTVARYYSKIIIVSTSDYSARSGRLRYFKNSNGSWDKVMDTGCHVGKAGIGTASEYSTKTPTGQYTFTKLMGIAGNPGTIMSYHQIDDNDYWCGGSNYNEFVDEDVQEHPCSKENDEHLLTYYEQYQYVAAFNYNPNNIEGKGSAFFLHCQGGPAYTGGCVAIPTGDMRELICEIDTDTVMIIDLEDNIADY